MMNIYNGNVVLDANGEGVVGLPEWFGALNRDYRSGSTRQRFIPYPAPRGGGNGGSSYGRQQLDIHRSISGAPGGHSSRGGGYAGSRRGGYTAPPRGGFSGSYSAALRGEYSGGGYSAAPRGGYSVGGYSAPRGYPGGDGGGYRAPSGGGGYHGGGGGGHVSDGHSSSSSSGSSSHNKH